MTKKLENLIDRYQGYLPKLKGGTRACGAGTQSSVHQNTHSSHTAPVKDTLQVCSTKKIV